VTHARCGQLCIRLCRVPRHRVGRDQRHPAPGVLPKDRVAAGAGAEPSDARGAAVLVTASDPVDLFEMQLGVPAAQFGRRGGGERRRRDVTAVLVLQPLVPKSSAECLGEAGGAILSTRDAKNEEHEWACPPCWKSALAKARRATQSLVGTRVVVGKKVGEEADEEGGEVRRASRYFDSKPNFKLTTLRYRLGLAFQTTVPPSTPSPTFF
jgi:hypothetical protein